MWNDHTMDQTNQKEKKSIDQPKWLKYFRLIIITHILMVCYDDNTQTNNTG